MPYPMTRLCGRVGRNELKFHSLCSMPSCCGYGRGALQAPFKIFWLDASLRHHDACRLPIADKTAKCNFFTLTSSKRLPQANVVAKVWLSGVRERMPARATAYRLFKLLIIKDFQASKYLVTSKT